MRALDLRHVQEARLAAHKTAAREGQFRDRLEPAFVQGPRAIGNAFAAFQHLLHRRVMFEALEFHIGEEMRVFVVEADHEADRNLIAFQMIHEGPTIGLRIHRPAGRMHDLARLRLRGIDFPQFLDPDAVGLDLGVLAQVEFLHQQLAQMTAAALGEHGLLGMQFHTDLEHRTFAAVLQAAHIAGRDALHAAILVVQDLGGGEAGIDFHAHRLGLLAQPAAEVTQRDDVIAVIVHLRRRRQAEGPGFGQEQEMVLLGRSVERRALFLPVRDQFVQRTRLQHRAGQDMRAHFRALFDDADGDFLAGFLFQLLQADRGGQTGRARAHDHHIIFHAFAFDRFGHSTDPLSLILERIAWRPPIRQAQ